MKEKIFLLSQIKFVLSNKKTLNLKKIISK